MAGKFPSELINNNIKQLEYLTSEFDPSFDNLKKSILIVKDFIITNKLILYGGSAIDYALRLKGDKIYPDDMLAVPDLDFYSPDNVEDAYKLADILFFAGFKQVKTVRARYIRTMRVDLDYGHFIADITYCPKDVIEQLPTLEYNGMRIIHPDFQRIDLHSSLSIPYDNPPTEVVFQRWAKDIKRFNLLDKYYPMCLAAHHTDEIKLIKITISSKLNWLIFNGFAAFAILKDYYLRAMDRSAEATNFVVTNTTIEFMSLEFVEVVHFNLDKITQKIQPSHIIKYEPFISALSERAELTMQDYKMSVLSTKDKLISTNIIKINGANFKIVNIHYLLRYFAAMAVITKNTLRALYQKYYTELLQMTNELITSAHSEEYCLESPFYLTTYIFGSENNSLAYTISLNMVNHDVNNEKLIDLPWNYYPYKSIPKKIAHPVFNYSANTYFSESGRIIEHKL